MSDRKAPHRDISDEEAAAITEAQGRVYGPRNPNPYIAILEMAVWLPLWGAYAFGQWWVVSRIQRAQCPADTFLAGSPGLASLAVTLPLLFAAMAPAMLTSNALTGLLPPVRDFIDGFRNLRATRQYRASQALMVKLAIALALIAWPISLLGSLTMYCATPSQFVYRGAPWSRQMAYRWDQVARLETSCVSDRRGSWTPGYTLTFTDNRRVDLMGGTAPAMRRHRELASALHGHSFEFDASGVRPGCGVADVDMLTQRP